MNSKTLMYAGISGLCGLIAFISLFIFIFFMHYEVVDVGHEKVLIDRPYMFGNEGVRPEPLKEGRKLVFDTTTSKQVRMTPQSVSVKVDDYSSSDNILLDFDSTIQYRFTDSIKLVKNFGDGWFENNIKQPYLALVREAIKKRTMTEMMSSTEAAKDIDNEVTTGLQSLIKESGVPIVVINVALGRAKPNDTVLAQMNETAAQQQRKKTLIEATLAEKEREKEQVARAVADNAYRNAMQLSPEMFIRLEEIKRFADACAKAAHCIVTPTGSQQVLNVGR